MTRQTLATRTLAVALFVSPSLASAQAQEFTACYVEEVGAVYFINLPGLPTECLSPTHQQVEWTEGGEVAIGAGAVSTAALADGAVSNQKLAASSVSSEKIQPGAVTGTQLSVGRQTTVNEEIIPPGVSEVIASCPGSTEVLGGGFELQNTTVAVDVIHSLPRGEGWAVTFRNRQSSAGVRTYAVCADLG